MWIIKWLRRLKGYVRIRLSGPFPERFLNLAIQSGLCIWHVRKEGPEQLSLFVARGDFFKLQSLCKKSACSLQVVSKVGAPFSLFRNRKRVGVLVGLALFVFLCLQLLGLVWSVELIGAQVLGEDLARLSLSELGLYPGARSKDIDIEQLKLELMRNHEQLAWVGIRLSGTHAVVEFKERSPIPEAFPADVPCNIVAKFPGQILSVEARVGEVMVQNGQAVDSGQLIVSGVLDSVTRGARYVHADARVYAQTIHKKTAEVPLIEQVELPTGEEKTRVSLKIFGGELKCYVGSGAPYEKYDKIESEKQLTLFGVHFPLSIRREVYQELSVHSRSLSLDEALAKGQAQTRAALQADAPDTEVLSASHEHALVDGVLLVTSTFICREDIALREEILLGQ